MKNIFVSSTFLDFQEERDILRKEVMPQLNAIAAGYGESVSFSDLRWGINTSEIKEEDVSSVILSSCLDEIDRSRPYMLILLGERYGFTPGEELIKSEVDRRNLYLDDLEISITQLEIEYGLFDRNEGAKHVFIYFREDSALVTDFSKDESAYRKLQKLKSRIMYDFGECVHFYSKDNISTGEFTQIVIQDILQDLETEWNESIQLSEYEREYNVHHLAMIEKAKYFSACEEFATEVMKNIQYQPYSNYALVG